MMGYKRLMTPDLIYNIADESLRGRLGGVVVNCHAVSGGRAGSKTKDAANPLLANNALATHVHAGAHVFGPLPQGFYFMDPHKHDAHMVRLEPFPSNHMFGRGGFLIHGRGKIGSHGCIVPSDFGDVLRVCKAVTEANKNGQRPVLKVIAIGADIDRKLNFAKTLA
jgi:hypothetical protein